MSRKHDNREPRRPVLVLASSEFERLYFLQMRRECRYVNMHVELKSESSQTLDQMIKEAGRLRRDYAYASAWCICNPLDVQIDRDAEASYRDLAGTKRVELIFNAPGIELWFLLHLEAVEQEKLSREDVAERLRRLLPGFSFSSEYMLHGAGRSLYRRLFPQKGEAVLRAGELRRMTGRVPISGDPRSLTAGMPAFTSAIIDMCGTCFISRG